MDREKLKRYIDANNALTVAKRDPDRADEISGLEKAVEVTKKAYEASVVEKTTPSQTATSTDKPAAESDSLLPQSEPQPEAKPTVIKKKKVVSD